MKKIKRILFSIALLFALVQANNSILAQESTDQEFSYTVNYLDKSDNAAIIPADTFKSDPTKDEWSANPFEISGYEYISSNGQDNMIQDEDNATITINYYYNRVSDAKAIKGKELKARVIARYVDVTTKKDIQKYDAISIDGLDYNWPSMPIDGYTFLKTIGEPEDKFKIGTTTITHYYVKDNVDYDNIYTVNYIDNDTKEKIVESDVYIAKDKDKWQANPYEITGYKYIEANGMKNVSKKDNNITVNYYYKKSSEETPEKKQELKANLLIEYKDVDTNKILDKIEETTISGIKYTAIAKEFKDYKLVKTDGEETGIFKIGTTKVTYYYENKNKPIIDEGKIEKDPIKDTKQTKVTKPESKKITKNEKEKKQALPQTGSNYLLLTITTIVVLTITVATKRVITKENN
ncbi:MucBP domain-containing protein [Mycoplasma sp. P36-A1]|uniref:MucBP domain-containing protein n=1 Tax=Mycoplasma sp. P36-A1 TaxID=3252900 RepID=UPI003C3045DA